MSMLLSPTPFLAMYFAIQSNEANFLAFPGRPNQRFHVIQVALQRAPPPGCMKAAGKNYDPVTYEGAGHGFMRAGEDPSGNEANKKAHDEAWQRWLKLLKAST
jgi:dienelactone hydrolase